MFQNKRHSSYMNTNIFLFQVIINSQESLFLHINHDLFRFKIGSLNIRIAIIPTKHDFLE